MHARACMHEWNSRHVYKGSAELVDDPGASRPRALATATTGRLEQSFVPNAILLMTKLPGSPIAMCMAPTRAARVSLSALEVASRNSCG